MMTDEETAPTGSNSNDNENSLSSQSSLSYAGIFICATILLISLTSNTALGSHKHYEYGISVACIAMILSFVGWMVTFANKPGTEKAILYNNYFLFVWNFVGAGFLTFGGPFETTGNGYFAAWGTVVFATMALGVNSSSMQKVGKSAASGAYVALFACSIVVMTAISFHGIHKNDAYFGEMVYALILTIITILVTAGMLKGGESTEAAQLPAMISMTILWSVAAGLLTFRGPFLVTGNGYFGSWGGCLAGVFGANSARTRSQQQEQS